MKTAQEVFADGYTAHLDEIYRYVFFAVRQHQETAEDITNDIFLKAWKNIKQYDPERASIRTYLFRMARSVVIDHWRTAKDIHQIQEDNAVVFAAEQQQSVDAHLFWNMAQQQLSAEAYELMVLKYRNGCSIAEIAEITERSENAIKSSLKRSRVILKKHVEIVLNV